MDPFKNVAGAVVLLFMLLGAVDLILVGLVVTISGIVQAALGPIIFGAILLSIGGAMAYMFWRSS